MEGTKPKYILLTHNHHDHIGVLAELHDRLKTPVAAHEADMKRLPVKPEVLLNDSDILEVGKVEVRVLHTPGHTPGSVCFLIDKYLISGDTIFAGGPGMSVSNKALKQTIESLKAKIFVLPDDTQIHPGHGESTVLKKEKTEFAVFESKPHDADLHGDVVWLES
jgi:glyoxylase-like metal-dependent hydrolase (beta-lactamase superfamily II)